MTNKQRKITMFKIFKIFQGYLMSYMSTNLIKFTKKDLNSKTFHFGGNTILTITIFGMLMLQAYVNSDNRGGIMWNNQIVLDPNIDRDGSFIFKIDKSVEPFLELYIHEVRNIIMNNLKITRKLKKEIKERIRLVMI